MYTSYKSPPNLSIKTPSATQHSGNTDLPSPGVTVQESCVCHVLTWTPSVALLATSWLYFFPFFFFFLIIPHMYLSASWLICLVTGIFCLFVSVTCVFPPRTHSLPVTTCWFSVSMTLFLLGCVHSFVSCLESTYKRNHMVFVSAWHFSQHNTLWCPPRWQDLIIFNGWVISHCLHTPHLLYSFFCGWPWTLSQALISTPLFYF